jgi:hypothetical protein
MNMMTLVDQLRASDSALAAVDLVFEGDDLAGDLAKQDVNKLTLALLSSKTVTKVHLTVTQSADDSRGAVPQWKLILRAVSNMERLTDLSITAFYDRTGKHTLRLSSLACVLQKAPSLQKLTLDSVGFLDDDNAKCFAVLQEACRQHKSITNLEITNYYFSRFSMPDWWSQTSRLVQALATAPALTALKVFSVAPFRRRPNLTLECLNTLFSHPTLLSLTLQDLVIWGSGSGKVAAESLRRNSRLETLELRSCVLAGDASILAGLDGNATLQRLDMTDADLSMEAPTMAKAMVKNKVLKSCILSKARLGGDEEAHHSNLCNIIRALESHPTMTELAMQGMHSYIYEDKTRPVSFIRLALDVIVQVLESNRALTEIRMDEVVHDKNLASQKSDVNFYLGLNRSGYWELSQDGNDKAEWVESMAKTSEQAGCLFVLLRENPLLCQTEERREVV